MRFVAVRQRGLLAALVGVILFMGVQAAPAHAAGLHHAGLEVRHGNGALITRTIAFSEDAITGLDLLERSGLAISIDTSSGIGAAIAKIDGEGCNYPKETAFCKCPGRPCIFWNYFHQKGGAWLYSNFGASGSLIHDGDVDAWGWGDGTEVGQIPPIPFSQFYSPPATATPVPPTATPRPPTPTAIPSTATAIPATVAAATSTPAPPTPTNNPTADAVFTRDTTTAPVVATPTNTAAPATTAPPATAAPPLPDTTTAPVVAAAPATVAPSPTAVLPQPVPDLPPTPADPGPPVAAYALFGVVALGLGGLWLWNTRRR